MTSLFLFDKSLEVSGLFRGDKMEEVLRVNHIGKRFGGLEALHEVDLTIGKGQIFALIGPNGSGKTTLLNLINGIYTPSSGEIEFRGEPITGLSTHDITRKGIGRTFQTIRLFPEMSVKENVMVGRHCRTRANVFSVVFRTDSMQKEAFSSSSPCESEGHGSGGPLKRSGRAKSLERRWGSIPTRSRS